MVTLSPELKKRDAETYELGRSYSILWGIWRGYLHYSKNITNKDYNLVQVSQWVIEQDGDYKASTNSALKTDEWPSVWGG